MLVKTENYHYQKMTKSKSLKSSLQIDDQQIQKDSEVWLKLLYLLLDDKYQFGVPTIRQPKALGWR